MTYKVIIAKPNKKFPIKGLNELLNSQYWNARTKKFHNEVKASNDKECRLAIYKYMRDVKLKTPIRCTYLVYAEDKRHDRGNVTSACEKSFLDALQQCKCLSNDGFNEVLDPVFRTLLDKNFPRIEVFIEEEAEETEIEVI